MKKIIILIIIFLSSLWFFGGGLEHQRTLSEAKKQFRESRKNSSRPGSYEFASKGIEYQMSEDVVNSIMDSAYKVDRHAYQESPPWNGYVNIYEFRYGNTFKDLFSKNENYLIEEIYYVYFTNDSKAIKLRRILFGAEPRGTTAIELESKSILR